jgi:hypothetical protein
MLPLFFCFFTFRSKPHFCALSDDIKSWIEVCVFYLVLIVHHTLGEAKVGICGSCLDGHSLTNGVATLARNYKVEVK